MRKIFFLFLSTLFLAYSVHSMEQKDQHAPSIEQKEGNILITKNPFVLSGSNFVLDLNIQASKDSLCDILSVPSPVVDRLYTKLKSFKNPHMRIACQNSSDGQQIALINEKNTLHYFQISKNKFFQKQFSISKAISKDSGFYSFTWLTNSWLAGTYWPGQLVLFKLHFDIFSHQPQTIVPLLKFPRDKVLVHTAYLLPHPQTPKRFLIANHHLGEDKYELTDIDPVHKKYKKMGTHQVEQFSIDFNGIRYALQHNANSVSLLQENIVSLPIRDMITKLDRATLASRLLFIEEFFINKKPCDLGLDPKKIIFDLAYKPDQQKKCVEIELKEINFQYRL